jgi:hypothetical protein
MDPERVDRDDPAWAAQLERRHGPVQGPGAWRRLLPTIAADVRTQPLLSPEELRAVGVPTLMVYGDRDVFVPIDHVVSLYRQLPEARLFVAPETGHQVRTGRRRRSATRGDAADPDRVVAGAPRPRSRRRPDPRVVTDGVRVPLHEIAHGRAGDKGNRCNISVIAFDASAYPALLEQVTPERVHRFFAHRGATGVTRYELPLLGALNLVIDDVLEGGVNGALNLDGHGKTLSYHLLAMEVEVAPEVLERSRAARLRP